jgi:hypothetical protein
MVWAAEPRTLSILRAAAGTYYRRFGTIALLGLAVFAPAAIVDGIASRAAESLVEGSGLWLKLLVTSLVIIDLGAGAAALTLYSGVLDRLISADRRGHSIQGLKAILRTLPWGRLLVADLLVWGVSAVAAFFLLIPGLIAFTLLSIAGPVIIIEDLRPLPALRRSMELIARHALPAVLLVTLPTVIEEIASDLLLESSVVERLSFVLLADIALAVVVTSAVGVLEITMAHALIQEDQRRRSAAGEPAAGTAMGAAAGREPAAVAGGPLSPAPVTDGQLSPAVKGTAATAGTTAAAGIALAAGSTTAAATGVD